MPFYSRLFQRVNQRPLSPRGKLLIGAIVGSAWLGTFIPAETIPLFKSSSTTVVSIPILTIVARQASMVSSKHSFVLGYPLQLVRRGIVSPSSTQLLQNTLGFGIPALFLFVLRISNRIWVMRRLRTEDYMMIAAMCFYISLLFFINYSSTYATNLYPPEDAAAIYASLEDVANRIYGSKLVIPLEQSMLASTWLVKLCIWFFISRIAQDTTYTRPMRWLMIYIIAGYLTIEVCYFAILCRPFKQYWAMPVTNPQCTTYQHYSIIQMVFNISSDMILLAIPLWITWNVKLPRNRKVIVTIPFLLGGITIACAICNKAYNFASPMTTTYQLWYIREASVSIWVGNIICTWQLFQKLFRLRTFDGRHEGVQREVAAFSPSQTWREKLRALKVSGGYLLGLATNPTAATSTMTPTGDTKSEGRHDATGSRSTADSGTAFVRHEELSPMPVGDFTYHDMITLQKDDDDATHAIIYRKRYDIV